MNMSTDAKLKAEAREDTGKGVARKLRAAGRLPAVLYGAGAEPVSLSLDAHETILLFEKIPFRETVLHLEVAGSPAQPVRVKDVQAHPYRSEILHVDFLRVGAEG
jgi:large subunit ribosomal protein L25